MSGPETSTIPAATTRRDVLKALSTALVAASFGLGAGRPANADPAPDPGALTFDFGPSLNPIIFEGAGIRASRSIGTIDFFLPLFGPERPEVNPAAPRVERGQLLEFPMPGEYYLRMDDGRAYLKVLVLSRQESYSGAMLRLFNFCVANMLYSGAHDDWWTLFATREGVIRNWFRDCEPLMVSCSPTHAIFRRLVRERFALPTRVVSFPGTHLRGKTIVNMGHNVPEVYLPDLGRWAAFDVNHGFVVRWQDSIAISTAVQQKWGARLRPGEHWRQLGLDVYTHVESSPIHPANYHQEVSSAGLRVGFSPHLVAERLLHDGDRSRALRAWSAGPVYWGANATSLHPVGTEFLPGNGVWACTPRSRQLKRAARKALDDYIPVREMKPRDVQKLLEEGHREVIRQAVWRDRVPELDT